MSQSGPEAARANLSARQAKEAGLLMSGTYGLHGSISSSSAALASSLASRLQARLASVGSILYKLTWKERVTPAGRSISALRASAHRTSGSGFTSWPTPDKSSGDGGRVSSNPLARTRPSGSKKQFTINEAAQLASWATPTTRDHKDGACQEQLEAGTVQVNSLLGRQALLTAPWPTPMAGTPAQNGNNEAGNTDSSRRMVALVPSGPTATGSPASTEKRGQLSPAHCRWLMGLPGEWDVCVPTATRSSRRARKSS